jgi:hypothetical protein
MGDYMLVSMKVVRDTVRNFAEREGGPGGEQVNLLEGRA